MELDVGSLLVVGVSTVIVCKWFAASNMSTAAKLPVCNTDTNPISIIFLSLTKPMVYFNRLLSEIKKLTFL
jgi:hypothetical protein